MHELDEQGRFKKEVSVLYKELYERTCKPNLQQQRAKLESLRYRFGNYVDAPNILGEFRFLIKKYLGW